MQVTNINFNGKFRMPNKLSKKNGLKSQKGILLKNSQKKFKQAHNATPKNHFIKGMGLAALICYLICIPARAGSPKPNADTFISSETTAENGENASVIDSSDDFISSSPLEKDTTSTGTKVPNEITETPDTTIEETQEETEEPEPEIEPEPKRNFEINLSEEQEQSLNKFIKNWEKNSNRYENIEKETGIPAELIAAIHWRESNGKFNTYLHDGSKLGRSIVANGKKIYFDNFEEAAIHAMNTADQRGFDPNNIETYYEFAERYNGTGYRDYHEMNSPYVWAGTDKYTIGKYDSDGHFDPNLRDRQVGVAILLDAIMQ